MLKPIVELEEALARLPGFGKRSARRAALALVKEPTRLADTLMAALRTARERVCCCEKCGAFTTIDEKICRICSDPLRDSTIVCVIEEPSDIIQLESSGAYKGLYHSLGGKIAPSRRMGPENIRIQELMERVEKEGFHEVFLALSTDMEGDATANYITELLIPYHVKVSRLAFGLPIDSGVAYSDPLTLKRAINSRNYV